MLNSKLLFALVLLLSTYNCFTQTTVCNYTLSGKVIDEHDKTPLMFATVYIKELERGSVSDDKGNYKIENLCKGTYTLIVSHLGCHPITETITLTKSVEHHFYPEHHTEELKEFTLQEKGYEEEISVAKKELSVKELNQSRGESLGESLKTITGVTSLNTGNSISKPVIHGLHSDRVLILNNGIRQEGQQWGNEHAPEIDPYIADKLSVIKGADGIRYGANAIAGVVLVEPRALRDSSGMNGELNLAGASNGRLGVSSATLDGNIGKLKGLSWRLQGTLKRSGNVTTPNYYLKNTGLKEYNFSWALGFNKEKYGIEFFYSQFNTDIGIFSAAHIGNLTDFKRAIDADEPLESANFTYEINRPFQHIEHELFKVKAYWLTGDIGKLNFIYARQYNLREEYDKHLPRNDSLAALNLPELQFEITTHLGELSWKQNRKGAFNTQIGVATINQANTFEGREFIPAFIKYGTGIFLIEKWRSDDFKLELETGLRYDYIYQQVYKWNSKEREYNSYDYTYNNISGSVGAIYKPNDKLTTRVNFGMAWRPPNVSELFSDGLHHGAAAVEYGDTNLIAEKAYNTILAVDYVNKGFLLQVEGYYNHISNFIYLKPTIPATLTIRGAFPTFNYTQVDAALTGVDLKMSYQFVNHLTWTGKTSFLNAYNLTANEWLVGMPANRFENILEYKLPKLKKLRDVYLEAGIQSVLKQDHIPANSDYSPPPNAYNLLSAGLGFGIPLAKKQELIVDFKIKNLLNTAYRDYLNRFRYYADEMGRNYTLKLKLIF
ncbi:MAG: TonB-dependent receptor [Flavobacteriales bacterium]|nr:TonB-dependent receptor [Flavobacteriales bacterium]